MPSAPVATFLPHCYDRARQRGRAPGVEGDSSEREEFRLAGEFQSVTTSHFFRNSGMCLVAGFWLQH
jgi:hypothetical protein